MTPLPLTTSTLKPSVDVFRFDDVAMLNVIADGSVRAWCADKPITLSTLDDWHLGSFAVAPDADHAELAVEIDGVRYSLAARWPAPVQDMPEVATPNRKSRARKRP